MPDWHPGGYKLIGVKGFSSTSIETHFLVFNVINIPSHLYGSEGKNDPKIYSAFPSWHPDGKHIVYEHFEIARSKRFSDETHVEGYIKFYKVNVDSALKISNLSLY